MQTPTNNETHHPMKSMLTLLVLAVITLSACGEDKGSANAKPYPLETCVVSGEKLGEHGKPYVFVHEGQEIKMCCKACLKDFNKEPEKYLKQIAEAAAKGK